MGEQELSKRSQSLNSSIKSNQKQMFSASKEPLKIVDAENMAKPERKGGRNEKAINYANRTIETPEENEAQPFETPSLYDRLSKEKLGRHKYNKVEPLNQGRRKPTRNADTGTMRSNQKNVIDKYLDGNLDPSNNVSGFDDQQDRINSKAEKLRRKFGIPLDQ